MACTASRTSVPSASSSASSSRAWLPPQVRGERVLDDLQFALWPADAIRAALPAGWTLGESGGGRQLAQDGKAWLVLEPLDAQRVRLRNLAEGYELVIESMDMGQATQ